MKQDYPPLTDRMVSAALDLFTLRGYAATIGTTPTQTATLGTRSTFIVIACSTLTVPTSLTAFALSILAVGGTATWTAIIVTFADRIPAAENM